MLFSELAKYLDKLEKTSSRLEITAILSDLFNKTKSDEIDKVVYLSLGILAPNYEGVILNLAEKMMIRVVSLAFNKDLDMVKRLYKKSGDLGDVAQSLNTKKDSKLRVSDVYEKLLDISGDNGEGSQDRKVEKMSDILKDLDSLSSRFVTRIPVGKLRLGFSEKTILDALGINESYYNIYPDIGRIARLKKEKKLETLKPEVGVPVVPMLAARLNSASEMVKKMGKVSVEPKFDGLRIFIHHKKKNNFLKVFTRNMNLIANDTFPELKDFGNFVKADEIILDTEAVGLDEKREGFVDFQKTIQRRRKHDVKTSSSKTPLQFQVFDVLSVDGKSLINEPYLKRREILEKVVIGGNLLRVDENTVTDNPDVIRDLHEKYLKMGLEGIIVKKVEGKYTSGRTGWNWVKMKEEEGKRGKLADTLDCVIMGFTVGKGKRSGFGVGQFLAGIKDGDNFKTITKVGTGITDEKFGELKKRLEKIIVKVKPKEYGVHKDLTPDFWVEPKIVVELAADEITVSPKHTAGFALRFPRLIKFRDDKQAIEATDTSELKVLFSMQKKS